MEQNTLNIIYIIFSIIMSGGLVYFSWRQMQINKRIEEINKRTQELEDYVAISIVPITNAPGNYELQVMNTGKVNVYLKKFEIGQISYEFPNGKERLISVGGNPFYRIPVKNFVLDQELDVKLYLIDEFDKKYLSLGGFVIDSKIKTVPQNIQIQNQQDVQQFQQTPTVIAGVPVIIPGEARAWTYKTIKYDWKI